MSSTVAKTKPLPSGRSAMPKAEPHRVNLKLRYEFSRSSELDHFAELAGVWVDGLALR